MKKRKIALCLSGGGLKGQFQLSAISELRKIGMEFDYINGISIGSLIGAFEAMDKHDKAVALFDRIVKEGVGFAYTSEFMNLKSGEFKPNMDAIFGRLTKGLNLWDKIKLINKKGRQQTLDKAAKNLKDIKGLADNTPLLNLLKQEVKREYFTTAYGAGVVSMETGAYSSKGPNDFNDDENLNKFILGSSNMPGVWPPVDHIVTKTEELFAVVDGGLRNISPLGDVVRYIEEDESDASEWLIVVINCGTGYIRPDKSDMNVVGILSRALNDIALSEVFQNDVNEFLRINRIVRQCPVPLKSDSGRTLRSFDVMLIQPDEDSLGDTLDASPAMMSKREVLGREKARTALEWAAQQGLLPEE